MSLQVEKLEKNMAKLTIEVGAEEVDKAIQNAYKKNKNRFNVPGFRKGKVPFHMIEKMYGVGVFYEDAANELIGDSYPKAADESGLQIVARPEISVEQIEKGKSFIYVATVATMPEVTLGEYKGLEVEKMDTTVTDEDLERELKKVQDQNARLVTVEDRPVADKDEVTIDFEGFVDGQAFEGGKGENYPLTIGSHSFIDTFEEQLIGKNLGEECEVNVTFPEEYHAKELAGKPAMFKVAIKEIKVRELPEIDDEFAGEVSEFDTLDEYKNDLKAKLQERKDTEASRQKENKLVDQAVANAAMDIPEPMLENQVRMMVEDSARRMQSQGLSLEQYLQFTGMDLNKYQETLKPQAEKRIRTRLVLEAIVKAENIVPTEEEIDKEIANMAAAYQMEVEKLKEYMGEDEKDNVGMDIAVQKAVDLLVAEAKEI